MKKVSFCDEGGCDFEALPYYWRPLSAPGENEFPDTLPFKLVVNGKTGVLSQRPDPVVSEVLRQTYGRGAFFVGLMGEDDIGSDYARDFMGFIDREVGLENLEGKKVLEIGCGTGYLLHILSGHGAEVIGFEPGFEAIGRYNVPVIRKFFPSEEVSGRRFDVVIAYALIEHLEDPEALLADIVEHLGEDGLLLVSVPDCEMQILAGDISMLVHEHFSYLTPDTLRELFGSNGFEAVTVTRSSFGGSIYGAFRKAAGKTGGTTSNKSGHGVFGRINTFLEGFEGYLRSRAGKTLCVYIPLRAINALYLFRGLIDELDIKLRFFDDSPALAGKYMPCFDVPVEDKQSLIAGGCDTVVVFSYSFGRKIAGALKEGLPSPSEVTCIEDIANAFEGRGA